MNVTTMVNQEASLAAEIASLLHDLRNPLCAIHSGAEWLIGQELAEPQVRRLMQNLYSASRSMRDLIDNFLSRYRGTAPPREPCDLRELIATAVDKIALTAEFQSVEIVRTVPENLVLRLDRQRIQQVFVNLLV